MDAEEEGIIRCNFDIQHHLTNVKSRVLKPVKWRWRRRTGAKIRICRDDIEVKYDNQLEAYYLVKNSCIFNIKIIAGNGSPKDGITGETIRNIDNIDTLIENYGGEEDGWFKATGDGYININGEEKMVKSVNYL
jgi:hypothetical protein